jgi:hypothetical protein
MAIAFTLVVEIAPVRSSLAAVCQKGQWGGKLHSKPIRGSRQSFLPFRGTPNLACR